MPWHATIAESAKATITGQAIGCGHRHPTVLTARGTLVPRHRHPTVLTARGTLVPRHRHPTVLTALATRAGASGKWAIVIDCAHCSGCARVRGLRGGGNCFPRDLLKKKDCKRHAILENGQEMPHLTTGVARSWRRIPTITT